MSEEKPKLRPIQPHPVRIGSQPAFLLHDPLQLAENAIFFPPTLAPVLAFCDGSRDLSELRAALMVRVGLMLSLDELKEIIGHLDDALLLENERSAAAIQAVIDDYRAAPFRPPLLAGAGYPAEPAELHAMLDAYLANLPPESRPVDGACRALVSPHIDYQRGGPVYAQVWSQAAEAVRRAEVAVILGTDHHGDLGQITLTRQSYATPYGVLPTDLPVIDAIAAAIGAQAAYEQELNHRQEHSIELAAVWLHHMRGGASCARSRS